MEKLTLENIACNLPGLKFLNEKSGKIFHATGAYETDSGTLIITNGDEHHSLDIWPYKPLYRPMSDLTKPIIIEGKEVTPIVELAKIAFPKDTWRVFADSSYMAISKTLKDFAFANGSFFSSDKNNCNIAVSNQPQLFQWLYKNKFDLHGLIEKSLAIDANTLETNPYNN